MPMSQFRVKRRFFMEAMKSKHAQADRFSGAATLDRAITRRHFCPALPFARNDLAAAEPIGQFLAIRKLRHIS
jgi:hypothetical protein